jgi:DNA anti-recombination protein RmuC
MASRKASARKRTTSRRPTAGGPLSGALGRLERLEQLPPTLRDYAKQVRQQLDRLEAEIDRAQTDVRQRAARLLREASHQLGQLEAEGEAGWRRLAEPYRRRLADLVKRLEKALAPQASRARKTARKATRKASDATRAAAARVEQTLN